MAPLILVRPTERPNLNSNRTTFPSVDNSQTMSKSESEAKKAAEIEADDEPDEW